MQKMHKMSSLLKQSLAPFIIGQVFGNVLSAILVHDYVKWFPWPQLTGFVIAAVFIIVLAYMATRRKYGTD